MTAAESGWQITIEATPEPITIDIVRTAVIVVDMQNDFGSKGGMFDRAGVDISIVQKAIGPTRKVLLTAREAGIKIVYLKMGFRPDLSDLGDNDSPNRVRHLHFGVGQQNLAPDGRQGRFLIRDTWNTDVIAELRPEAEDVVLYKHRFSGFYQTELDHILRRQNMVQFCLIETAEPVLIEHHVLGFRSKLCDDIRVPCVADQKSSLPTVRSEVLLADTEVKVAYSVRGVIVPEVRQVGPEAHLQVNDFDSCLARRQKDLPRWADRLLNY